MTREFVHRVRKTTSTDLHPRLLGQQELRQHKPLFCPETGAVQWLIIPKTASTEITYQQQIRPEENARTYVQMHEMD